MMRMFLTAALLAATPAAEGAPLLAPQAMRPAIAATVPVETVACVRGGWRGPGHYPGCGPARRYYGPRRYYGAPYYYVGPRVIVAGPAYRPPRQCWIAGAWRPC
ncbi:MULTISPECIES: hypothetical protein [Rhodopseudomonas]|uniref:Uncharacterized protein n=1 Tax=Rhodopseudomonas palustris TaxID=1076 RepID=A0A0D7ENG5_RHOPL|nr:MULTISPECIES: hypothetical protein [Rhodopseudomonas]KIZ42323.1 hypothetical protein OO17_13100 [Rhodopseudomonas palustris]MDF3812532.1 hypothetical protein [Rhodopseudomonas sp. BAL398]WOK17362.1 hypothetical protein RBJ75_25125 [Rhodopseudomonas sp. BAL398]